MEEITLQALLEAGCHFGHRAERWNPKAQAYIYAEKDGIHIIDLAKTKQGLISAYEFVRDLVASGGEILFVGTKRQVKTILRNEATKAGAPFLAERWIGGFLTNWDSIRKNIEKINRLSEDQQTGAWKKFPKHEQSKLARYLTRIKTYYEGVLSIKKVPEAIFIIDVRREQAAVREAIRRGIPIVALVDTNSNPEDIDYVIPANDDAIGSVTLIVRIIAEAYQEGRNLKAKEEGKEEKEVKVTRKQEKVEESEKQEEQIREEQKEQVEMREAPVEVKKKRGRPKKVKAN